MMTPKTGQCGIAGNRGIFLARAGLFCVLSACAAFPLGLQYRPPVIEKFHPLEEKTEPENPLLSGKPSVLKLETKLFRPVEDIDFEKRQVTLSKVDDLGFAVWVYHYPELNDYLQGRLRYSFYKGWHAEVSKARERGPARTGLPSLEFALPVQYPKWAQRILGKEPPKLTVSGFLKITVGYETENYKETDRRGNQGMIFDQENSFSIRGTIGRVIDINIRTNSEESFDFNQLKNFKLEYRGEGNELEDEIIQEIVAGWTNFSMPSTYLSGYSEGHEGLFGVKIRSQIGPLALTTILSHEQGEAETMTRTRTTASMSNFRESDHVRYKFFWLDSAYLRYYLQKNANPGGTYTRPPKVTDIQIWIQAQDIELKNADVTREFRFALDENGQRILFRRLVEGEGKGRHYFVNREEGWVRIDSVNVMPTDIIGLYLRTDNAAVVPDKGDTAFVGQDEGKDVMTNLWFLKQRTPEPNAANTTYWLEWRNVYRLPRSKPDNFEFKILLVIPGSADTTEMRRNQRLSYLMGLTDESGKPFDTRDDIFDFGRGYLVIPPFNDAEIGNQPFRNPALAGKDSLNADIYTLQDADRDRNIINKYLISMSGAADVSDNVIQLGWGVMDNTDIVHADGFKLERGYDYVVDYDMGTLTLVSKRALSAKDIKASYQREALFVPEDKVFLGARGEVKLPFISENSFVGTSVLWQTASTSDNIPRIGHEPYSKLLLDFNTKLDFEPEWMTKLVDLLPLVKTETPSKLTLEFEVAHSRMDPNTKDEAYIDDFEASKQVFPLGESVRAWYQASAPAEFDDNTLLTRPPAWNSYWFQPVDDDGAHRVRRIDIWDLDESQLPRNSQEVYERVLYWVVQPHPSDTGYRRPVNPWAGIMTPIPPGLADRRDDQYLEFYARNPGNGKLHIDMGVLSEDLCINGGPPDEERNTEDTTGRSIFNQDLDVGLDLEGDPQKEFWVYPGRDLTEWDTLRYGNPALPYPEDPARDNFKDYNISAKENFPFMNGLEGNWGNAPSTEDINLDGIFMRRSNESFFRVTIDFSTLDPSSPFVDTRSNARADSGWYFFRIPINSSSVVYDTCDTGGTPNWRDIHAVRFLWTDFDTAALRPGSDSLALLMTRIQFVGNQWRAVAPPDDSGASQRQKLEVSVVNTDEDTTYRNMRDRRELPFTILKDDRNKFKREQALKLAFQDIMPGEAAFVERRFGYHPFDLSMYRTLSMFVYSSGDFDRENMRFVFRFGTDTSTYYEYHTDYLVQGWNDNTMEIDLMKLSEIKLAYLVRNDDRVDSFNVADGNYVIKSPNSIPPNFSNISWMAVGVVRDMSGASTGASGEIFVNEMKVSGISSLNGWAGRFALNTKWADFMNFNAEINYRDGNFRQMTDREIRPGNSTLGGNMGVDWRLDKFLPAELGISVPLGTRVSGSLTRPQLRPNSDIFLTDNDGNTDNLSTMASDAVEMLTGWHPGDKNEVTKSEHYQTRQVTRSWNTSYDKNKNAKNPLVNLTADRISIDYRYNNDEILRSQGQKPDGKEDYVDTSITETHGGWLRYDLTPRKTPEWTKWKPFGDSKADWIPKKFKNMELSLLPTSIKFDLANVTYTNQYQAFAKQNDMLATEKFGLNHGFSFRYVPISPILDIDYNLRVTRDLDKAVRERKDWSDFFRNELMDWNDEWERYYLLAGESRRTQDASLGLRPQFFEWLTHDFSYKSNYSHGLATLPQDSSTDYLNANVGGTFTLSSDFTFTTLFGNASSRLKNAKGLSTIFAGMEKGFEKLRFRTITFRYDAVSGLNNYYIGTDYLGSAHAYSLDFFSYQLGLEGRSFRDIVTGDMDDASSHVLGGWKSRDVHDDERRALWYTRDTRTGSRKYSLSTSLTIPDPFDLQINPIRFSWDNSYTVYPDTGRRDTAFTLPDLQVGVSSPVLSKIGVIDRHVQQLNLSSSYNFRQTTTLKDNPGVAQEKTASVKHGWNPLVKVQGRLRKRPINIAYWHNYNKEIDKGQTWTQTVEHADNLTVSYEIPQTKKKREFKLFRWVIPIQGKTSLSVTGDHTKTESYQNEKPGSDFEEPTSESSVWKLKPEIRYTFTKNIDGLLFYEGTTRDDDVVGEFSSHKVALSVNIKF